MIESGRKGNFIWNFKTRLSFKTVICLLDFLGFPHLLCFCVFFFSLQHLRVLISFRRHRETKRAQTLNSELMIILTYIARFIACIASGIHERGKSHVTLTWEILPAMQASLPQLLSLFYVLFYVLSFCQSVLTNDVKVFRPMFLILKVWVYRPVKEDSCCWSRQEDHSRRSSQTSIYHSGSFGWLCSLQYVSGLGSLNNDS